jgi:succinoglycan biosynthesis protein ExoV
MKLWHCVNSNFGDALNPWLWDRLLPGLLNGHGDTLFVGIGTILDARIPAQPIKLVFSSGTGYGAPPALDDRWHFYCVRGPLTARRLGLPADRAVTDGAALLPLVVGNGAPRHRRGIAFMPHHYSKKHFQWRSLCRRLGLTYLDPEASVPRLLRQIAGAELVLAEAMHAAIVADALRVPWVAVSAYDHINSFKWEDWCASLELQYQPNEIPTITDNSSQRADRRLIGYAKRVWRTGSLVRIGREDRPVSPPDEVGRAADRLAQVRDRAEGQLSADAVFADRLALLQERLEELKAGSRAQGTGDRGLSIGSLIPDP